MNVIVDLHRHDQFSSFDGFGKSKDLARLALTLGHSSLSTSNHGTTANWVQHYFDCKEVGIKPILGVEAYFKPIPDIEGRGWHLCLFAKDSTGYYNINRLMLKGEKNKYYNPIITFDDLRECSQGVICTTACIASYTSDMLRNGKKKKAVQALEEFRDIFADDFYVEIQPYIIDKEQTQEKVDLQLMQLAQEMKIKCILTSDSHYGSKEDFPTYLKMHEIAKHGYNIVATYGERYMPTEEQLKKRFVKMHEYRIDNAKRAASKMISNLQEIEDKIDGDFFDEVKMSLPIFDESKDSYDIMKSKVRKGLKKRDKYTQEYIDRCNFELDVIHELGYDDYFLMVADYVNWAKDRGIIVGPGRGSGCNCLVAYVLGITDVDSLKFDLDFSRFLRKDKKKMPDFDVDFETIRRQEVIEYLIKKYKGHAAQVANYGLYKVDNLINDLAKVCGLNPIEKEIDKEVKKERQDIIAAIKKRINKYKGEIYIDLDKVKKDKVLKQYDNDYDEIITHFCKLYCKVRFIGTHAAGVAISGQNLLKHCAVKKSKEGKPFTYYDLNDLEKAKVAKFDILGLNTMEELGKLRELTGNKSFDEKYVEDELILQNFREGNTNGVFQFESATAKSILQNIECDCFEDIIATNAMNRPGPLSLDMPQQYAENKMNSKHMKKTLYYKYTKKTYGTIVYQEQIQQICVHIGKLPWDDADKIMKMMKGGASSKELKGHEQEGDMRERFINGAMENKMSEEEAADLYDKVLTYSFNKGHAAGYSLISVEEMFYKVYHPHEFWLCKLQTVCKDDHKNAQYKSEAIKSGCVILLPHVNGSINYESRELEGEKVIQEGLSSVKGVGLKAAITIIENGPYVDMPDFEEKLSLLSKEKKRTITKKTIAILKDKGCFEFNENRYLKNVVSYNSSLYGQSFHF